MTVVSWPVEEGMTKKSCGARNGCVLWRRYMYASEINYWRSFLVIIANSRCAEP